MSALPDLVVDCLASWRTDPDRFVLEFPSRLHSAAADAQDRLAASVGDALQAARLRVAVAESCTGGGIGAALTAIAGSSAWVEGGMITYSNAAKTRLLGVPEGLLAAHGAVSGPVVRAMAEGVAAALAAECAIAVSGVAGPGGGTPAKPVGTVWLAWCAPSSGGRAEARLCRFAGDRAEVRQAAVWTGLVGLLDRLLPPGRI